jgi:ubiquinone/menaquinone biosynthesis C-methylase UbiE
MVTSESFRDFEHAGWIDNSVALSYHSKLGEVTRACVPAMLEAAGLKTGDRVLDVACGAGYVAAAARDRGAEAVGVDFSAVQVRLAEQSYPGIRFVEGDAEALPFIGAEFDVVFNAFGLPHVPNPEVATAEAYVCSNREGVLSMPRGAKPPNASVCRCSMMPFARMVHSMLGCPQDRISSAMGAQILQRICSAERDSRAW